VAANARSGCGGRSLSIEHWRFDAERAGYFRPNPMAADLDLQPAIATDVQLPHVLMVASPTAAAASALSGGSF
jgi:hypothetical protein